MESSMVYSTVMEFVNGSFIPGGGSTTNNSGTGADTWANGAATGDLILPVILTVCSLLIAVVGVYFLYKKVSFRQLSESHDYKTIGVNGQKFSSSFIKRALIISVVIFCIAAAALLGFSVNRAIAQDIPVDISKNVTAYVNDDGTINVSNGVINNNSQVQSIGVRQVQTESDVDLSDSKLTIKFDDFVLYDKKIGDLQLNDDYCETPKSSSGQLCYSVSMPADKAKQLIGSKPITIKTTVDLICTNEGKIIDDDKNPMENVDITYVYTDWYKSDYPEQHSNEYVFVTKTTKTNTDGKFSIPQILQDSLVYVCAENKTVTPAQTTEFYYFANVNDSIGEYVVSSRAIEPTVTEGLVYTGKEQIGVNGGANITLTDFKAIDAGDYIAKATPKAGYTWKDTGSDEERTYNWKIEKADIPVSPSYEKVIPVAETLNNKQDGKITGLESTMEYSRDSGSTWTAIAAGQTEITGLGAGTYQVRFAGDKNHNPSDAIDVEVAAGPKATMTYHVNGGSGSVPVDKNKYSYKEPAKVLGGDTIQKEGSYFVGWNTKSDYSGKDYVPDQEFIILDNNPVLYAKWDTKPVPTADQFKFTPPENLVYDKTTKQASIEAIEASVGDITQYYCKSGTEEYTIDAPKDAGTYYVFIHVKEGEQYAASYVASEDWKFTIEKKAVIVKCGMTAVDRNYNGDIGVDINTTGAVVDQLCDGDGVTVNAKGAMPDKTAGDSKNVNISIIDFGGTSGHNYKPASDGHQTSTTVKISPSPLTVEGTTIEAKKVYDGTTSCKVTNNGSLKGKFGDDDINLISVTAAYVDANVGYKKHVNIVYSYSGSDLPNYSVKETDTFFATIECLDIKGAEVSKFTEMTYTGQPQQPSASVKKDEKTVSGSWSLVTNVPDLTTFSANGNFTGTIPNKETGMKKAQPKFIPPTVSPLTYNDQLQNLIGAAKTSGGTLQYAVTEDTKEPSTGWSAEVPQRKNSGTYYVWYRVVEDANYLGVAPDKALVTIKKADIPVTPSKEKVIPVAETINNKQDGKITGVESSMEYSGDSGSTWIAISTGQTEISGLGAGTYLVRFAGDINHNPSDAIDVVIAAGPKVTMSYKVNGGSGSVPVDTNQYSYNEPAKILGGETITKAGNYFVGWNTKPDYSGYDYVPDQELIILDNNPVLYAKWDTKPVPTADKFDFTAPKNLVYDKTEKQASIDVIEASVGDITQYYCKSGTEEYTTEAPIDAGTYYVFIRVEEGEQYAESYVASEDWKFTIEQKSVVVKSGMTGIDRNYNGSCEVDINTTEAVIDQLCDGDVVTVNAKGAMAYKNVGDSKKVNISVVSFAGPDGPNYKPAPKGHQGNTTVKISPAPLTVEGTTIEPKKVYDGTTSCKVTNDGTLKGKFGDDDISISSVTAAYADANAGNNKTVNISYSYTGKDLSNYSVAETATLFATIECLDIKDADVSKFSEMTYTGQPQQPSASVTKVGQDVTGSWSLVTNVADLTTFTANGNYTGIIPNKATGMKKANPTVTAPTVSTLTYKEQSQNLIGAAKTSGGTLQYAVTGDTKEPSTGWSVEIPQGKNVGTYYVWYKVVEDANYFGVTPNNVKVTIEKAENPMTFSPEPSMIRTCTCALEIEQELNRAANVPEGNAEYKLTYISGNNDAESNFHLIIPANPNEKLRLVCDKNTPEGTYKFVIQATSGGKNYKKKTIPSDTSTANLTWLVSASDNIKSLKSDHLVNYYPVFKEGELASDVSFYYHNGTSRLKRIAPTGSSGAYKMSDLAGPNKRYKDNLYYSKSISSPAFKCITPYKETMMDAFKEQGRHWWPIPTNDIPNRVTNYEGSFPDKYDLEQGIVKCESLDWYSLSKDLRPYSERRTSYPAPTDEEGGPKINNITLNEIDETYGIDGPYEKIGFVGCVTEFNLEFNEYRYDRWYYSFWDFTKESNPDVILIFSRSFE